MDTVYKGMRNSLRKTLFRFRSTLSSSEVPAARSLASHFAKQKCPHCNSPINSHSTFGHQCPISGFPIACSKNCGDSITLKYPNSLDHMKTINEDLHWFRSNEAVKLMKMVQKSSLPSSLARSTNWHEFCQTSGVHLTSNSPGMRLISAAYTYVMTLSYFFPKFVPDVEFSKKDVTLLIVGARAECTMPSIIWEPLYRKYPEINFTVKMVGNHVPIRSNKSLNTTRVSENLVLESLNGFLHEISTCKIGENVDAIVLFNPGVGNLLLKQSWLPSLEIISKCGKPVLLTSFSDVDQEGDVDCLRSVYQRQGKAFTFIETPQSNPFGSLKYDINPEDLLSPIQCNKKILIVQ